MTYPIPSDVPEADREYYRLVARCAAQKIDLDLRNQNIGHAKFIIGTMLDHAVFEFRMFARFLDDGLGPTAGEQHVEENVIGAFRGAAERGVSIQIITDGPIDVNNALAALSEQTPQLTLKQIERTEEDHRPAFATADDHAYRLNIANASGDLECEAAVNFNSPKSTQTLNTYFDIVLGSRATAYSAIR